MRKGRLLLLLAAAGLTGCGGGDKTDEALADSLRRDLQLVPAESSAALNDVPAGEAPAKAPPVATTAPRPATPKPSAPAPQPTARTLAAGTTIATTALDSISSRHNKAG